jgi:hypothetical protein
MPESESDLLSYSETVEEVEYHARFAQNIPSYLSVASTLDPTFSTSSRLTTLFSIEM